MALYRFLFAPVLLAVAVLTATPRHAPRPAVVASHRVAGPGRADPNHAPRAPSGAARAVASHPSTVH